MDDDMLANITRALLSSPTNATPHNCPFKIHVTIDLLDPNLYFNPAIQEMLDIEQDYYTLKIYDDYERLNIYEWGFSVLLPYKYLNEGTWAQWLTEKPNYTFFKIPFECIAGVAIIPREIDRIWREVEEEPTPEQSNIINFEQACERIKKKG